MEAWFLACHELILFVYSTPYELKEGTIVFSLFEKITKRNKQNLVELVENRLESRCLPISYQMPLKHPLKPISSISFGKIAEFKNNAHPITLAK